MAVTMMVLGNLALLIAGWAICTTILFDGNPEPPFPRTSLEYRGYEQALDLNRNLIDGGRYVDGDSWFARRIEDIRSMGTVTENEVSNVHAFLGAHQEEDREAVFKDFGGWRGKLRGDLNNYVSALGERYPEKLDEFVGWIAAFSGVRVQYSGYVIFAGETVMWTIFGTSRSHLSMAVERLPIDSSTGPSRNQVIDKLGGGEYIAGRILMDYFAAVLRGESDAASTESLNAGQWYRLAPARFPDYLDKIARHDHSRIAGLIDLYNVKRGARKYVAASGWTPKSQVPEHWQKFEEFLRNELGLTVVEVKKLQGKG